MEDIFGFDDGSHKFGTGGREDGHWGDKRYELPGPGGEPFGDPGTSKWYESGRYCLVPIVATIMGVCISLAYLLM